MQICEICVPIHSWASFCRAETCTQIGTDFRGLANAVATRDEGRRGVRSGEERHENTLVSCGGDPR